MQLIEVEKKRLPFQMHLPADLIGLYREIKRYGKLFVVGGAVRDALLGKTPKDYDLVTNLSPDKVISILSRRRDLSIDLTGKHFGVVRVKTPDKNEYEIATFREDLGPGRRPNKVRWATIEDDVRRRDLTVNALFYDIDKGEVVDLVGGIDDLLSGTIRAVGHPSERFLEDPLRTLRAIRFAARMGSKIDPKTSQAIRQVADGHLSGVSNDRIQDEFVKGLRSAISPSVFIKLLKDHGLLQHIFPGLKVSAEVPRASLGVQLATMLLGNDPDQVKKILKEMRFKNAVIDLVYFLLNLARLSPDSAPRLKKDARRYKISVEDIRQFSRVTGYPSFRAVRAFIDFLGRSPSVNARDLMAQGLKGPEIGQAIQSAETQVFKDLMSEALRQISLSKMICQKIF